MLARDESVDMHVMPPVLMKGSRDPDAFRSESGLECSSTGGIVSGGVLQLESMQSDHVHCPLGRSSERAGSDSAASSFRRGPVPDASDTFVQVDRSQGQATDDDVLTGSHCPTHAGLLGPGTTPTNQQLSCLLLPREGPSVPTLDLAVLVHRCHRRGIARSPGPQRQFVVDHDAWLFRRGKCPSRKQWIRQQGHGAILPGSAYPARTARHQHPIGEVATPNPRSATEVLPRRPAAPIPVAAQAFRRPPVQRVPTASAPEGTQARNSSTRARTRCSAEDHR